MHIPVLQKQVLEYLDPKPNENFIDCTINGGGHSRTILEKIKPKGRILGIELDQEIFQRLSSLNLDRVILVNDSYTNLKEIVKKNNFSPVNGILFDLGMSSWHLEESGRGFSFQKDEPLDMRYDTSQELRAEEIINKYSQKEIEKILKEFGEERFAKRVAKRIVENRPIKTTLELVKVIKQARVHSLSRIFQALRIAVNQELSSLEKALAQVEDILAPGGRLVVISFHSLEDRIVKNFFKDSNLKILLKKPIRPLKEEIKENLRSRSSKLRAGIKQ
jgi:16S rRNA (cytosine1402-N4)-methyltransferase